MSKQTGSLHATATGQYTIPVGEGPRGLAANKDGSRLYVVNYVAGSVSVIDTLERKVIATIKIGEYPQRIVLNPNEKTAYVSGFGYQSISVIDIEENLHLRDIFVGPHPWGMAVSPDGEFVYALDGYGQIAVIDTNTFEVNHPWITDVKCRDIGISPDGALLYLSGERKYGPGNIFVEHALTVLNAQTFETVDTVTTGQFPWWVSVNPDGTEVYVSENLRKQAVIDTREFKLSYVENTDDYTEGSLAFSPGFAYRVNGSNNTVSVIDTTAHVIVRKLELGESPGSSPWNIVCTNSSKLYITETGSNCVRVIQL